MGTIIKIKDALVSFYLNYFWGTVTGAFITSAFLAAYKAGDVMGNTGENLENAAIHDAMYSILNALHIAITVYWDYMGKVDIIILIITIALLLLKGLFGYSPRKGGYF
jgi:hypothetical protein